MQCASSVHCGHRTRIVTMRFAAKCNDTTHSHSSQWRPLMNRKNWLSTFSVGAVLVTATMIAFAAPPKKGDPSAGGAKKADTMSLEGKAAPDFTFNTVDGKEVKL